MMTFAKIPSPRLTCAALAAVVCLRFAAAPALGQNSEGTIAGVVRDATTGTPVSVAHVQVVGTRFFALTGGDGRFAIGGLPVGTYTLAVSGVGYGELKIDGVTLVIGGTVRVSLELEPAPIPIEALVVTPGHFGVAQESVTPATLTMTREEIEVRPQLGEDIFRAVNRLPGIASGDISTVLWVRGGLPGETLNLLDGLELYEPFHLKDFDGVLSIIDAEVVGGVDFTTSGFTSEYGDKLTGVFNMQALKPGQRTRTSLGLSFMNLRFMSQGAFNEGRGQWLVSARRGYLDIVLAITGGNDNLSPTYYDVFGKFGYQLSSDHSISARFLYAGDKLNFFDDGDRLDSDWMSAYAWADWDARLSRDLSANTMLSVGRVARNRLGEAFASFDNFQDLDVLDDRDFDFFGVKQDWGLTFSDRDFLRFGFDFKAQVANYSYHSATRRFVIEGDSLVAQFDTLNVVTDPTGEELGLYITNRYRIWDPLTVELGLRYDRQTWSGDSDLAPRLNLNLALGRTTNLRAAVGRYNQAQGIHELFVGDGQTSFFSSQLADQLALGLEHTLDNGVVTRLEAYRRDISDPWPRYVNLDNQLEPFPELEDDRALIEPTSARAEGVELFVQRDVGGRFSWSGSYALARTEDEVNGRNVPRTLDQRHTVVLNLAYRPNPRWQFSAAWQYHSGWPFTPAFFSVDTLANGDIEAEKSHGPINSGRLPAYLRLDVRATRNFTIGRSRLAVYLDVFNLAGRANLRGYVYDLFLRDGELEVVRIGEELLPFLPSFGVRLDF